MLGFNYESSIDEVKAMIQADKLDQDIKEYIIELLEGKDPIRDIKEYFELTCINENKDGYSYIGASIDEEAYNSMSKKEKLLHNDFQLRVLMVYNQVKEEYRNV